MCSESRKVELFLCTVFEHTLISSERKGHFLFKGPLDNILKQIIQAEYERVNALLTYVRTSLVRYLGNYWPQQPASSPY
jgi:hypothetical protein